MGGAGNAVSAKEKTMKSASVLHDAIDRYIYRSRAVEREASRFKRLRSRFWDVETMALGAPELHVMYERVPWLRRLARDLRHDDELVVILLLATVVIVWGFFLLLVR